MTNPTVPGTVYKRVNKTKPLVGMHQRSRTFWTDSTPSWMPALTTGSFVCPAHRHENSI
jgi:hypothetical protein